MPSVARPIAQYRRELLRTLLAQAPASVLDVGCGDGALLRELSARGVAVGGVEIDPVRVDALSGAGIAASLASAEELPFPSDAFDWVVMQYTAHHLADLRAGMAECWRVARVGVMVLDPWYDVSITSQSLALDFDRWSKCIDRLCGEVHGDCLAADEILGPLSTAPGLAIEIRHMLKLVPVPLDDLRAHVSRQLARIAPNETLRREADALLVRAERDGVSDDGAMLVIARRRGVP